VRRPEDVVRPFPIFSNSYFGKMPDMFDG